MLFLLNICKCRCFFKHYFHLHAGEHEIVFTFGYNVDVKTTVTINEKSNNPVDPEPIDDDAPSKNDNPQTSDNVYGYVALILVSLLGIIISTITYKRNATTNNI